ncbi:hypothetical protein R1flu_016897 [Riccia fluitans]|uniref:Uncharacterized protein n=1 Tax=Riccia fluitans TaxID=41844 RepID=A0ABD1YNP0_9MARC
MQWQRGGKRSPLVVRTARGSGQWPSGFLHNLILCLSHSRRVSTWGMAPLRPLAEFAATRASRWTTRREQFALACSWGGKTLKGKTGSKDDYSRQIPRAIAHVSVSGLVVETLPGDATLERCLYGSLIPNSIESEPEEAQAMVGRGIVDEWMPVDNAGRPDSEPLSD